MLLFIALSKEICEDVEGTKLVVLWVEVTDVRFDVPETVPSRLVVDSNSCDAVVSKLMLVYFLEPVVVTTMVTKVVRDHDDVPEETCGDAGREDAFVDDALELLYRRDVMLVLVDDECEVVTSAGEVD